MSDGEFYSYLAGFIDGEGCFTIQKHQRGKYEWYGIQIQITNTNRMILEFIKEKTKVSNKIVERKLNKNSSLREDYAKHCKPVYSFSISNRNDCLRITNELLPYLRIKKEQAIAFANFIIMRIGNKRFRIIKKTEIKEDKILLTDDLALQSAIERQRRKHIL